MNCTVYLEILLIGLSAAIANAELSGLLGALQYFGFSTSNTNETAQGRATRGQCQYTFEAYALMQDHHTCVPDDEYILHIAEQPQQRKPPIMIKCVEPNPLSFSDDGNSTTPRLLVMQSVKDIVNLLKPVGNATKRHEYGSCVVVHFCTPTSLECARVAPLINFLPYVFPTLPVAYIDAYKYPRFNAEFGIVSLPTLMLFHQGRALIKYDPPGKLSLRKFILRHTNIKTVQRNLLFKLLSYEPLPLVPDRTTDFNLIFSWAFILLCAANHIRRMVLFKQLVEMVQRIWRESEETQMEMVD